MVCKPRTGININYLKVMLHNYAKGFHEENSLDIQVQKTSEIERKSQVLKISVIM